MPLVWLNRVAAVELAAVALPDMSHAAGGLEADGHHDGERLLRGKSGALASKPDAEEDGDDWDAVITAVPAPATPAAIPGLFGDEEYTEAQRHGLFVFRYLLVFVAALESFAHGANDTGNATGMMPLDVSVPALPTA
jgi:phosphate/sulfate permease